VDWLDERDRAALFASPGLGKTVTTLKAMERRLTDGRNKGFLVIAPIRVGLITWPDQVATWQHSTWMKVADMRTPEGAAAWEKGSADVYFINGERLASIDRKTKCKCGRVPEGCSKCQNGYIKKHLPGFVEKFIRKRKVLPVDGIVWDELSLWKDHSGKRVRSIYPYLHDSVPEAKRPFKSLFNTSWGLTGTPVCNSYTDLYMQVCLLDGGARFGRSFGKFRDQYFEPEDYNEYKWKLKPGSKEEIDAKIADLALVMLGDDYLDLPETLSEDIEIDLPPAARAAYKELEKELLLELETGDIEALSAAALATKLLQLTGGAAYDAEREVHFIHDAKIKALQALRKKHGKEPMLVLTAYKHENERVLAAIPGARMFHEKDLDLWKAGKIHTWVANCASLSHGIDGIQKGGRIACWFTLTYSNEKFLQTNARLIRTGQSFNTIIYRLIAKGTIDVAVAEVLRNKFDEHTGLLHSLKALQRLAKAT
jgi:hypothetical protein